MNRPITPAAARLFGRKSRADLLEIASDLLAVAAIFALLVAALFIGAGLGLTDTGLALVEVAP